MFNNARKDSGSMPAKRGVFSVLGSDLAVTGNIVATADLHVDGRVEGDVQCATLIQGAGSHIVGGVTADTARIAGTVEGNVRVGQLTVERGARIVGDVEYDSITVETGGHVDGRLRHVAAGSTPALPAPRAVEDIKSAAA